jgi:regulator of RNase E activity RraA
MSTVAHRRRIAGTVVHGACRDVAVARHLGYPLFSRGRFMRTGKDRVQLEAVGHVVSLGEVRVSPGDVLLGDDDGLVVVPAAYEQEVLQRALATREAERRIMERVSNGQSLRDAREAEGYHLLQRRES